jgi:hypothetical protein
VRAAGAGHDLDGLAGLVEKPFFGACMITWRNVPSISMSARIMCCTAV